MEKDKKTSVQLNKFQNNKADINQRIVDYIKAYDNFLNKIAYGVKRKCQKLEFEDIKQQIILSLFTNTNTFDSSRESSANTYFSQVAMNSANNIVKRYWKIKNRVNVECVSLDAFIKEDESSDLFLDLMNEENESLYNPENYFLHNELVEQLDFALNTLSTFERKVFYLYMDGCSVSEISLKVKKSKRNIYNTLRIIKNKIKSFM